MQASEIKDEATLRAWLDARPEESRQSDTKILAFRSAMRVVPQVIAAIRDDPQYRERLPEALPVLRGLVLASVDGFNALWATSERADALSKLLRIDTEFMAGPLGAPFFALKSILRCVRSVGLTYSVDSLFSVIDAVELADLAFDDDLEETNWDRARDDAILIESNGTPKFSGLWIELLHPDPDEADAVIAIKGNTPIEVMKSWQTAREWLSTHPGHDFWIRWYEAALHGRPLTADWNSHWDMLRDIALIPNADWNQGAEHVARLIAEIEERYKRKADVMIRPATLEVSIHEVQRAVVVNRLTLPPTFDAVYGQINLEIQRLQGINCWDSDEQCEQARALIRRLTAMAEAVQNLRTSVEAASTEPTEVEAAKTKSLLELYAGHLKSWPRDNAADLTDSVWRLGLSGASTGLMAMLGVPLPLAFSLAGALFGGKKLTDALKAGSDSKSVLQP